MPGDLYFVNIFSTMRNHHLDALGQLRVSLIYTWTGLHAGICQHCMCICIYACMTRLTETSLPPENNKLKTHDLALRICAKDM